MGIGLKEREYKLSRCLSISLCAQLFPLVCYHPFPLEFEAFLTLSAEQGGASFGVQSFFLLSQPALGLILASYF